MDNVCSVACSASPRFTRGDIDAERLQLMNAGRWGNADVFLYEQDGEMWVIKDFSRRAFPVRHLLGRLFVRREVRALQKLQGLEGVPQGCFRLDAFALCYKYVPGRTLNQIKRKGVGREYFLQLEELIQAMHRRGVVHLDVRYRRNVLITEAGAPGLLDFQTSILLHGLPPFLREFLAGVDMSAVNKLWWNKSPDSMDKERIESFHSYNRMRRFWIITGYLVRTRAIRHFFKRREKRKEEA